MDVKGLTTEQREKMRAGLMDSRNYLDMLLRRMVDVGWDADDPIMQSIVAARASLHAAIQSFPHSSLRPSVPKWVEARR